MTDEKKGIDWKWVAIGVLFLALLLVTVSPWFIDAEVRGLFWISVTVIAVVTIIAITVMKREQRIDLERIERDIAEFHYRKTQKQWVDVSVDTLNPEWLVLSGS